MEIFPEAEAFGYHRQAAEPRDERRATRVSPRTSCATSHAVPQAI